MMENSNEQFLKCTASTTNISKEKELKLDKKFEKQNLTLDECDQEQTPKAEVSTDFIQQFWPSSDCTGSVDLEDEKLGMTCSYSEILEGDEDDGDTHCFENFNIAIVEEKTGVCTGYTDEADLSTPVCEGIDPTQVFLSEDRVNAFMQLSHGAAQLSLKEDDDDQNCQHLDKEKKDEVMHYVEEDLTSDSSIELCKRLNEHATYASDRCLPIDPTALVDLETFARNIATSMDTLIENLTGTLHSISSLTVDCVETYKDAVCKTCDAVDSNIKSMYQLMAKCEELSKSMKPIYHLQEQIKEIRRLLDLFESVVHSGMPK